MRIENGRARGKGCRSALAVNCASAPSRAPHADPEFGRITIHVAVPVAGSPTDEGRPATRFKGLHQKTAEIRDFRVRWRHRHRPASIRNDVQTDTCSAQGGAAFNLAFTLPAPHPAAVSTTASSPDLLAVTRGTLAQELVPEIAGIPKLVKDAEATPGSGEGRPVRERMMGAIMRAIFIATALPVAALLFGCDTSDADALADQADVADVNARNAIASTEELDERLSELESRLSLVENEASNAASTADDVEGKVNMQQIEIDQLRNELSDVAVRVDSD